jgi:predicted short-subunit dehydrogenase-like oxidoreductase (DUF2520 family)
MDKKISINILGSGNVATHLIREVIHNPQIKLQQIYARHPEKIKEFEKKAVIINNINHLQPADISIMAINDDAIGNFSKKLSQFPSLVVHTSGSMPMNILHTKKRGVLYPFQSFTKEKKEIEFKNVPIFIEAVNEEDLHILEYFGKLLSDKVYKLNSYQRQQVHLAGVFAANFVNHMYAQAINILEKNQIPPDVIYPLIMEVAQKAITLSPKKAQTGPAIRKDQKTINKHLEILNNKDIEKLYKLITESIINFHK